MYQVFLYNEIVPVRKEPVMHVTTKFIAHGADLDMHLKHFQQTFKHLRPALTRAEKNRNMLLRQLREHEGEDGSIPREQWNETLRLYCYVEKQTITSGVMTLGD